MFLLYFLPLSLAILLTVIHRARALALSGLLPLACPIHSVKVPASQES